MKSLLIISFYFFLTLTAIADNNQWTSHFQHIADSLIKTSSLADQSQIGIHIYDLTADSTVYAYGKDQMMRPASVLKLLTAASALYHLGGNYQYTTSLYIQGSCREDSVLQGNLYIKAGYDPCFNEEDMKALADSLESRGIKCINGNIYTDLSFKDTLKMGYGWLWNWQKDELPLTPLLYHSDDTFMDAFMNELDLRGIIHPLQPVSCVLPTDKDISLLCRRHHCIDEVLLKMLKDSNNQYAESLFYQLASSDRPPYSNYRPSSQAVKDFIQNALGENPDRYDVYDGSGLSVYNCLSPSLIVKLLRYIHLHPALYRHIYPSLPIAGEDGTLSRRMKKAPLYYNVRAKTGTVRRVVTIAGYCTHNQGHHLAFAIFHNGIASSKEVRNWDDVFLETLVNSY